MAEAITSEVTVGTMETMETAEPAETVSGCAIWGESCRAERGSGTVVTVQLRREPGEPQGDGSRGRRCGL
jgi:hypothetical protein